MSNWVVVYKSNNPYQIEIIKSVLENNDIEVVLINKMDSLNTHLMNASMELHIKPQDVINAKYILSKNEF